MAKRAKKFPEEIKGDAARMMRHRGKRTVALPADPQGVTEAALYRWAKKQRKERNDDTSKGRHLKRRIADCARRMNGFASLVGKTIVPVRRLPLTHPTIGFIALLR